MVQTVVLRLYRSLVRLARTFDANPSLKVGANPERGRGVPVAPTACPLPPPPPPLPLDSPLNAPTPSLSLLLLPQTLICRNHGSALPEPLDSLVARFLGGSHVHFYWPPPPPTLASPAGQQQQQQQQQLVLDAVRDAFRQPVRVTIGGWRAVEVDLEARQAVQDRHQCCWHQTPLTEPPLPLPSSCRSPPALSWRARLLACATCLACWLWPESTPCCRRWGRRQQGRRQAQK